MEEEASILEILSKCKSTFLHWSQDQKIAQLLKEARLKGIPLLHHITCETGPYLNFEIEQSLMYDLQTYLPQLRRRAVDPQLPYLEPLILANPLLVGKLHRSDMTISLAKIVARAIIQDPNVISLVTFTNAWSEDVIVPNPSRNEIARVIDSTIQKDVNYIRMININNISDSTLSIILDMIKDNSSILSLLSPSCLKIVRI